MIYAWLLIIFILFGAGLARAMILKSLAKKVARARIELQPLLERQLIITQRLILELKLTTFDEMLEKLKRVELKEDEALEKKLENFRNCLRNFSHFARVDEWLYLHNKIQFLKGNYNDNVFLFNDFYFKFGPGFGHHPIAFF